MSERKFYIYPQEFTYASGDAKPFEFFTKCNRMRAPVFSGIAAGFFQWAWSFSFRALQLPREHRTQASRDIPVGLFDRSEEARRSLADEAKLVNPFLCFLLYTGSKQTRNRANVWFHLQRFWLVQSRMSNHAEKYSATTKYQLTV